MPANPLSLETDIRHRLSFGRKLRAARRRAGLRQKQLGEIAGVGTQQVCHMERGRSWPSFPIYRRMCRALGFKDLPLTGR